MVFTEFDVSVLSSSEYLVKDFLISAVFSHNSPDISFAIFGGGVESEVPLIVGSSLVDFNALNPDSLSNVYLLLDEVLWNGLLGLYGEDVLGVTRSSRDVRFEVLFSFVFDRFKFSYQSVLYSNPVLTKGFEKSLKDITHYRYINSENTAALRALILFSESSFWNLTGRSFVRPWDYPASLFHVICTVNTSYKAVMLKK